LDFEIPADDKEVLEAQRTFAKKYDQKVNHQQSNNEFDFDDEGVATDEEFIMYGVND